MPSLLILVCLTALGLALLALIALAVLVVARIVREHDERAAPDRRAKISKALLDYAVKRGPRPALDLSKRAVRRAVVETMLDALPFLRDAHRQRLEAFLLESGLDRRLRRQMRAGSVRDRIEALEALVMFPGAETVAALRGAERSNDLRIWLEALRTRTLIGAGPGLSELLKLAERPGARRAPIMHELMLRRAKADLDEALRALRAGPTPLTRALLIRVLGQTKNERALAPIKAQLANEDGAVRCAAAEALGELGFDAAGDALAAATRDRDWRVRLKACEAIGALAAWRCARALAPLLDDPVWWVRLRAEEALGRLGRMGRAVLERGPEAANRKQAGAP